MTRHEHNAPRGLALPSAAVALLATLALRGPQTVSELRVHTERLHRFADASSVEGFLTELAERGAEKGGPLAVRLPRAAGAREARWAHLLCGTPTAVDEPSGEPSSGRRTMTRDPDAGAGDARTIDELRREIDELRQRVAALERARDGA